MPCNQDVLHIRTRCYWDVLLSGCTPHQDVLHMLTEAGSSSREREAWLLGKASLSC